MIAPGAPVAQRVYPGEDADPYAMGPAVAAKAGAAGRAGTWTGAAAA